MNMFEEALAIQGMQKMCALTQSEIAKKMGVSQSYIANKLRLLRLSDKIRTKILDTGICERQVRQLLRLESEENILLAIEKIKEKKMTVSDSEIVVDMLIEKEAPKRISRLLISERIASFESFLSASLKSLNSIGIRTDIRTEIQNRKRYITISIEEKI